MQITHVFAGIAVTDFGAACAWYERLFGRAPDAVPQQEEAVWHLAGGGSVYVVADAARAGRSLVTLDVASLAHDVAELARRGIVIQPPGGAPKVVLNDPDGNTITLFQEPMRNRC